MQDDNNKLCFIISPIGEPDSPTRKRANQILKHIFKPAAEECGYEAKRADEISEPGDISTQVINHILEDPIVIADLTERNPNVFYELAIRHAIQKPFIQIIEEGESIPFDVFGLRTIKVNHRDMDSVSGAKKDIIAQINSIKQDGYDVTSPVSSALDWSSLRRSENPDRRELAELIVAINELRSEVGSIRTAVLEALTSNAALEHLKSNAKFLRNVSYHKGNSPEMQEEIRKDLINHIYDLWAADTKYLREKEEKG